jgi:hypothetical protein
VTPAVVAIVHVGSQTPGDRSHIRKALALRASADNCLYKIVNIFDGIQFSRGKFKLVVLLDCDEHLDLFEGIPTGHIPQAQSGRERQVFA